MGSNHALDQYKEVLRIAKLLVKAEEDSVKACEARGRLEPNATRARLTSAEAKWSRNAEARDRTAHDLHVAVVRAGLAERFADSYYETRTSGHKWYPIEITRERP